MWVGLIVLVCLVPFWILRYWFAPIAVSIWFFAVGGRLF